MTKMALMKGHLLVAKELLDKNEPKQAEPHIGHPVEEIYSDVENQLKEKNVKEFKTTLDNLQDLVKAKPKDAKVATSGSIINGSCEWSNRSDTRKPTQSTRICAFCN